MIGACAFLVVVVLIGALLNVALPPTSLHMGAPGKIVGDVRYVNGVRVSTPTLETWGPRYRRIFGVWYRRVESDTLYDTETFARGPRPVRLVVRRRADGTRVVEEAPMFDFFTNFEAFKTPAAPRKFGRDA